MKNNKLPIAIIGGGPIGIAAAAHLYKNNNPFILFETGESIAAHVQSWAHVKLFSPWKYNMDKAAKAILKQNNMALPDENHLPTGKELLDEYLYPLSQVKGIKEQIHLNSKVIAVGKKGIDKMKDANRELLPFEIQVIENGQFNSYEASAVIDASGTWGSPNPLGSGGNFAMGEKENAGHIHYGIPDINGKDKPRYQGKNIVVVGGGHSAINSLLALVELSQEDNQTSVHWVMRKANVEQAYGGGEADALEARGALGTKIKAAVEAKHLHVHSPVFIHQVIKKGETLNIVGRKKEASFVLENIDEIIANTGARPNFDFLREIRYQADASLESVPALADLIDPNLHSCGTVRPHGEAELRQREKGFYIVGNKSYGRAPTFLMATGYEQIRSIVAFINGDFEAAENVELDLPETGVCSSDLSLEGQGCCAVPEPKKAAFIPFSESFILPQAESCCTVEVDGEETACCSEPTEEKETMIAMPKDLVLADTAHACCSPDTANTSGCC